MEQVKRYVGIDLHTTYVMIGAVDGEQDIVMKPRRVGIHSLEMWADKHLLSTDEVVVEISGGAWTIHDLLEPKVSRVVVANAYKVKLIASSFVKTDRRDTLALAKLLAANIIPEVWVPPVHVRELRALVAHRSRLVAQRTAARNRIWAVVYAHKLETPEGGPCAESSREWWGEVDITASERLRVRHNLDTIAHVNEQIEEAEREMALLSASEQWIEEATLLIQLPGFGMVTAMTVLGAVGDIKRFPSAKKLVGYAGLGARIHASGKTHRSGGITKQGRADLRQVMVEAAWTAVRYSPIWKRRFEKLASRIGQLKAIVAIARKLLVVVWNVLTKREADRYGDPETIERKMLRWGSTHRLATSMGTKPRFFAKRAMRQLGFTEE